ncbi:hypothetical protein CEXT_719161 [Caerostris extrusa]|uniref:Uncharacterized protein n=1 Tax=Caerostris extrusa TaxID=172846 RepID=A0AAV4MUS4_CAEEX|nr:hypothetical protein CEXT_719161 [Caerostris extrusa]
MDICQRHVKDVRGRNIPAPWGATESLIEHFSKPSNALGLCRISKRYRYPHIHAKRGKALFEPNPFLSSPDDLPAVAQLNLKKLLIKNRSYGITPKGEAKNASETRIVSNISNVQHAPNNGRPPCRERNF